MIQDSTNLTIEDIAYIDMINSFSFNNYQPKKESYPRSSKFNYTTKLETINIDKRREKDLLRNKTFIVGPTEKIEKDIKSDTSIFSSKFGSTLKDLTPYIDRYKCECGYTRSSVNNGVICQVCRKPVKEVGDDFEYGAYIVLKNYYVIHPNIFRKLQLFIGPTVLDDIIKTATINDIDGHEMPESIGTKDNPFAHIGMIDLVDRYDEVLEFFHKKKKVKEEQYQDLLKNRANTFTHSVFVYTALLRPVDPDATSLPYESTNDYYYMMSSLATRINDDSIGIKRNKKTKNDYLYDFQNKLMELYTAIIKIVSTKKGNFRTVFGGRCNFSGRNVIRQKVSLDIDQLTLSYYSLVELLQQRIINVLRKMYNISFSQAYDIWWESSLQPKQEVVNIINSMLNRGRGIPVLLNRNPTIAYGGILQMFVVGMEFDHTVCVPLRILNLLKGDFDGDVTNIFLIINKDFYDVCFRIMNPRNAMMISRNDGKYNPNTQNQRDTIINANTMWRLSMDKYTEQELALIRNIPGKL